MTENFTETLISAVKNSRVLWDINHKSYYNRLAIDREWTRIARDLDEAKDVIKGKWKNLRDSFRKELKKIPNGLSSADNEQALLYKGSWCHFNSMLFLKPIFTTRHCECNIEIPDYIAPDVTLTDGDEDASQSQFSSIPEFDDGHDPKQEAKESKFEQLQTDLEELEELLPEEGPRKPSQITATRKRKTYIDPNAERGSPDIDTKKVVLVQKLEDDDEDVNFFKSLLPHVRSLPPVNKLSFRSAVQNLLINEMVKFENRQQNK